jgi:hypothetical protein
VKCSQLVLVWRVVLSLSGGGCKPGVQVTSDCADGMMGSLCVHHRMSHHFFLSLDHHDLVPLYVVSPHGWVLLFVLCSLVSFLVFPGLW